MFSIYRSGAVILVLAFVALAGFAFRGAADAEAAGPGEHTSCMGHEASDISPPGSNSEFSGGMADFLAFLDSTGAPNRGAVVSFFAQLHEGSHEACDAAVE